VFDPVGYNEALVLKVTYRNVGSEPNRQRGQHLADEMGNQDRINRFVAPRESK
jgi:hypothetical protein